MNDTNDLMIAPTPTFARDLIGRRIKEHARRVGATIDILEAGCGRKWNIALADVPFRLTGIDLDADALAYRTNVVGDLDEAIVVISGRSS